MGARSWLKIVHLWPSLAYQTPMLWSLVEASSWMLVVVASARKGSVPKGSPAACRGGSAPPGRYSPPVRRRRSPPQGRAPRRIPRPERRVVPAIRGRAEAIVMGSSCVSRARLSRNTIRRHRIHTFSSIVANRVRAYKDARRRSSVPASQAGNIVLRRRKIPNPSTSVAAARRLRNLRAPYT